MLKAKEVCNIVLKAEKVRESVPKAKKVFKSSRLFSTAFGDFFYKVLLLFYGF
jgi:hypothetical protein